MRLSLHISLFLLLFTTLISPSLLRADDRQAVLDRVTADLHRAVETYRGSPMNETEQFLLYTATLSTGWDPVAQGAHSLDRAERLVYTVYADHVLGAIESLELPSEPESESAMASDPVVYALQDAIWRVEVRRQDGDVPGAMRTARELVAEVDPLLEKAVLRFVTARRTLQDAEQVEEMAKHSSHQEEVRAWHEWVGRSLRWLEDPARPGDGAFRQDPAYRKIAAAHARIGALLAEAAAQKKPSLLSRLSGGLFGS